MKSLKLFCGLMLAGLPPVIAQQSQTPQTALFTLMNPAVTAVRYLNTIREDDSLNVMRYEYLYNGAGIGVGDFNKDGLPDLFFSGNTAPDKLFLNEGALHFRDITGQARVGGNGTWATGVSVADVNGDGLPDIYVCHSGKYADSLSLRNELFINQGMKAGLPWFKDMAADYGLDVPGTQSTQAAFFDYDHDGDLDMFLLNHSNHTVNPFLNTRQQRAIPDRHLGNRLFRQDRDAAGKIRFTDVTLPAGIVNNALNFGLSVTISDMNQDGWPDIYTTSDYTERDYFYLNNRDGTFTESLESSFTHISKYSMGADIADYNNDGRPDLVTLDMLPEDNHRQKMLKGPDEFDQYHLLLDSGYYHQQMRNMLQLNRGTDDQGHLRFSEIGQLAGMSNTDWSWSPLMADFDNDGWKDLFISNGYLRDFTDLDFMKYTVADARIAAAKKGNQPFQTYNLVKKMPANKLNNYLFHNRHDLGFDNVSREWGFSVPTVSNAAVYADLDNDGDLDLVIANNNEPAMLYRNNESDLKKNHFLRLHLTGSGANTGAFGAKARLTTANGDTQLAELYPVRGYQSSQPADIFFGFPSGTRAVKLEIDWPDGARTTLADPPADSLLSFSQPDGTVERALPSPAGKRIFRDVSSHSGLKFRHRENDFIDFKDEVLLPYQLSRQGPALAKADVNGDGLDDIFAGGAIGQPGALFIQSVDGQFYPALSQPWTADSSSEEVNALFFDANGDAYPDLYVVSGGNEYADQSPEYGDHIYLNDGKGNFHSAPEALPAMLSSKFAIAAADFDGDGDIDLFVGGRGLPGSFPLNSRSYLLQNDSRNGQVRFIDVTEKHAPELMYPGMLTAAAWFSDAGDKHPKLILAGDWMPVMLFGNNGSDLSDITALSGLQKLNGMWSAIVPADLNGDGRIDFVLGNCGENNSFHVTEKNPITMIAADIDNNGSIDPLIGYETGGKSYPMASRDELLDEVPSLRRKFVKYSDYADITLADLVPEPVRSHSTRLYCDQLASGMLMNDGNGHFHFEAFPRLAQFSRLSAAVVDDLNGDGKPDLLLSGNFFPYRTQLGRDDAGLGLFLKGDGHNFAPVDADISGCFIGGYVRAMLEVKTTGAEKMIVIAKNDDNLQVIKTSMH